MSTGTRRIRPRSRSTAAGALAWALFALTFVLAPLSFVLAAIGGQRELVLPEGWESRLLLAGISSAIALPYATVGLLIARKEPRNPIGWIFLVSASLLVAMIASFGYSDLVFLGGEDWPAAEWAAWFGNWSFIPAAFVAPCLVAQLFPNGRPLPGVWRWLFWVTTAVGIEAVLAAALDPGALDSYPAEVNPIGVSGWLGDLASFSNDRGGLLFGVPIFTVSIAAVVVRFHRSRGIERQQMKWLAFGCAVPVAAFAFTFVGTPILGDGLALQILFVGGFSLLLLIPAAVAIAILRYRLYEIDRVISRTIVYGALTVILGAGYVALVLAAQTVFSSFAGGGDLAIAVSTLVVAALFLPLRSRVQRVVDRHFYRRRYDASRTLEAFGARLREQVELAGLHADLERAVRETMQPAHVSVWLREAVP
jgi:hypothetical protein